VLSAFSSLKSYSRLVLYSPIVDFPNYSDTLVALEAATLSHTLSNFTFPDTSITSLPEWLFGVACSDNGNVLYNKTLTDLAANEKEQTKQSYIGGEIWEGVRIFCTGWSIKAEERYTGPFGGRTKNPILFVSNTRDPITPIYKYVSSLSNVRSQSTMANSSKADAQAKSSSRVQRCLQLTAPVIPQQQQ
jgi:hypothetical protein